jgi:hypothetical protein
VEIVFMRIYRKSEEEWSLFDEDPIYERDGSLKTYIRREFENQDKIALESDVFRRILESEIRDDPAERWESTNSPKSKTRNALLTRAAYYSWSDPNDPNSAKIFDKEAWEQSLLNKPFYGLGE